MIKTFIISLLLVLSASTKTSVDNHPKGYFCTTEGTVLNYERWTPSSGKLWWRQTLHIHEVKRRSDGALDVAFSSDFQTEQVKLPFDGRVPNRATVLTSGDVQFDIAETASYAARKMFKSLKFKHKGGLSTLKATALPGDSLQDIHAVVSWAAFRYTIDYTDRMVLRRENVDVPAGTFDCIVVQERKLERRPFYKNDRITLTWYALGYGMVRHDTFFLDGQMESSEQLVSVTMLNK